MANRINILEEKQKNHLCGILRKSIQSANLNFILGSGCSFPAIRPLGNVEREIHELLVDGRELDAEKMKFLFLKPIAKTSTLLTNGNNCKLAEATLSNYRDFLCNILTLLTRRKNNILIKQANIFTTNYDLFIKKAFDSFSSSMRLNDGFNRNPKLNNQYVFSPSEFFTTTYNKGNLYNYQVEIPSLNLIKLHGSMTWKQSATEILFQAEDRMGMLRDNVSDLWNSDDTTCLELLRKFNDQFYVVLPVKDKFRDTLLNRTYYDLLRIYANELDKENTLLIAEGFSFEDEHILDITKRSLRNPTLRLLIFCYKNDHVDGYETKFKDSNNVDIIYSDDKALDFSRFNNILKDVLPYKDEAIKMGDGNAEETKDVQ